LAPSTAGLDGSDLAPSAAGLDGSGLAPSAAGVVEFDPPARTVMAAGGGPVGAAPARGTTEYC
jgi:hypothetical protein